MIGAIEVAEATIVALIGLFVTLNSSLLAYALRLALTVQREQDRLNTKLESVTYQISEQERRLLILETARAVAAQYDRGHSIVYHPEDRLRGTDD